MSKSEESRKKATEVIAKIIEKSCYKLICEPKLRALEADFLASDILATPAVRQFFFDELYDQIKG